MEDKAIHEMICAYASGCMDKDNFINFKEHINSGKDLPYSDLGEIQNIISLIPIILEQETPDPEIKKRVAKKLIELNSEIKAKKKEEKKKTEEEELIIPTPTRTGVSEDSLHLKRIEQERSDEYKDIVPRGDTFSPDKTQKIDKNKLYSTQGASFPAGAASTETKSKTPVVTYLLLFLSILGLILLAYFFYSTNKELETKLSEMKDQVSGLQANFSANQQFINRNMSLIEFFHYNDISVVNLENADSTDASGKLFLSFEEREALIQANNFGILGPENVYEVWYVTNNVSISMGIFVPGLDQKYFRLNNFPSVPKENIELFRVTIEPAAGSGGPTGDLVLFGSLVKEQPKPVPSSRRRRY